MQYPEIPSWREAIPNRFERMRAYGCLAVAAIDTRARRLTHKNAMLGGTAWASVLFAVPASAIKQAEQHTAAAHNIRIAQANKALYGHFVQKGYGTEAAQALFQHRVQMAEYVLAQ